MDNSIAFLSVASVLSVTMGKSSSTLFNASSYCFFEILFIAIVGIRRLYHFQFEISFSDNPYSKQPNGEKAITYNLVNATPWRRDSNESLYEP